MRKRRAGDHIPRLLRAADRDPAKGLTAADLGRTFGIAEATYVKEVIPMLSATSERV